jgi:hypothetical protein
MHNILTSKPSLRVIQGLTAIVVSTSAASAFVSTAQAQALFSQPKTFTVTSSCNATTSISSGSNPTALTVGQGYTALGENKIPGGTHAWITVPAVGGNRWVDLGCGTYGSATPSPTPSGVPLPAGSVPFFDNTNNPVSGLAFGSPADVTPPAPTLNSFDTAVVNLCSAPGTVVSTTNFKSMMNANPTVLTNVKAALGGFVISGRTTTTQFLDDLTALWFNAKAFDHVFCGEPVQGGAIGGLHFVGRYLELQQKGLAGRLANNTSREEVLPGAIYTIGAIMKVGSGTSQSSVKGYPYTLNAEKLLTLAAKAYKTNPNTTSTSQACLLPVTDSGKTFKTVFVAKFGGIRTFYPDATPSNTDPACK